MDRNVSLSEAVGLFLASYPQDRRAEAQQELSKFIRWFGRDRLVQEVKAHEVGEYAEGVAATGLAVQERLAPLKEFFSFAKKSGLVSQNLATHVKVRKAKSASVARPAVAIDDVHLTPEGLAAMQQEMQSLQEERVRLIRDIRAAAADKDFRENAPLHAAREALAEVESRARVLTDVLRRVNIAGAGQAGDGSRAVIGSQIVLREVLSGLEVRYTLVHPSEVNPAQGKISVESPVGKAVLGRVQGEEVKVVVPAGMRRYKVESVGS